MKIEVESHGYFDIYSPLPGGSDTVWPETDHRSKCLGMTGRGFDPSPLFTPHQLSSLLQRSPGQSAWGSHAGDG